MCEIFGYSGRRKKKLNADLKEFYSHADMHPNGWGLAIMDDFPYDMEKESVNALKSRRLRLRLSKDIVSGMLLAHIRYATIGSESLCNAHPFAGVDRSGRQWVLIHNGTIFEFDPMNRYSHLQAGETDSERILLYILDKMDDKICERGRELTSDERFFLMDKIVSDIAVGNKLNLMVYDGEILYAHTNCGGTLHFREDDDGITISTRGLARGRWQKFPMTRLIGFVKGEWAYEGRVHNHRYIEDQEAVKQLYLAYAGL